MTSLSLEAENVPLVDRERLEAIYDELKTLTVKLDGNPIEFGPVRFSNRIAKVRAMLTRVEQIFLQVSEDLHWYKRAARAQRMLFELERRDLMVNDPKCRVGRSQSEREALADVQLRSKIEAIEELESRAEDLEILMTVIKSKRTDLKDIQGRMRDQMKLIEHDLNMGARWGHNVGPSLASESVGDIDSLLASVNAAGNFGDDEEEDDDDELGVEGSPVSSLPDPEIIHDPAPVAEVEMDDLHLDDTPVIPTDLPDEGAVGELPQEEHSAIEVDSFLEGLDPIPKVASIPLPQVGSIEDLISSLAEE